MARFLGKILDRLEGKKLGRVETRYRFDDKTARFEREEYVCDAKDKPRLNPVEAIPVGRKPGVCKPEGY